jgi:hypothetical protein
MSVEVASSQEFNALEERVNALAAQLAGPPAPWVGIYVGNQFGSSDYPALFEQAYMELGHLSYVRCFDSTIKSDPATARFNNFKGVRVHYSLKPISGDHAGFAAGKQSADYRKVVSALPAGARLSVWHEPEDDMSGTDFLALTKRARDDLKAVRPDVEFVYTSMAYQWATNSKGNVGDAASWLEAAKLCDSVSTDVYAPSWDYNTIEQDSGFIAWQTRIAGPSGRPWGITERGIDDHLGEAARMKILSADIRYALNSDCSYFYYWNADWQSGDNSYGYALKGPNENALFKVLSAQGRCR